VVLLVTTKGGFSSLRRGVVFFWKVARIRTSEEAAGTVLGADQVRPVQVPDVTILDFSRARKGTALDLIRSAARSGDASADS